MLELEIGYSTENNLSVEYSNWEQGQGDNGDEIAGVFNPQDATWRDANFKSPRKTICIDENNFISGSNIFFELFLI